jgi:hypothetical protein
MKEERQSPDSNTQIELRLWNSLWDILLAPFDEPILPSSSSQGASNDLADEKEQGVGREQTIPGEDDPQNVA